MPVLERVARLLGAPLSFRLARIWWRIRKPVTMGVRAIVFRDGEVLLVRHTYRPGWFFPGGMVHRGETLADAARREVHEETGVTIGDVRLLGVYTSVTRHVTDHVAAFVAEADTETGPTDFEIAEAAWFPLTGLPPGADPSIARRLAELREDRWGLHGRW